MAIIWTFFKHELVLVIILITVGLLCRVVMQNSFDRKFHHDYKCDFIHFKQCHAGKVIKMCTLAFTLISRRTIGIISECLKRVKTNLIKNDNIRIQLKMTCDIEPPLLWHREVLHPGVLHLAQPEVLNQGVDPSLGVPAPGQGPRLSHQRVE